MSWWYSFLFFLPAGIANMSPVFAKHIPPLNKWDTPLDFGKQYHSKRIFGNNKTWRGLLFGAIAGGFSSWIIYSAAPDLPANLSFNFVPSGASAFALGALLGFGALAGDAIESFFKRRRNIMSGNSWFPFDQIDYIIGGLIATLPFIGLNMEIAFRILLIYFFLHLVISYIGYLLGLKNKPI